MYYEGDLWECEFGGLERWNGTVEWSTGLDYWSATIAIYYIIYQCTHATHCVFYGHGMQAEAVTKITIIIIQC